MDITNIIGTLAGTLTTIAFIPQVVRTWKTRSAQDISLFMFLLFSCGVLLWLIYGFLLHALPIILANGITLALSTSILVLKIRDMLLRLRRLQSASQRTL
ncbi:MAG TPA: SemiSWEET transporter [Gammaproteobacteria bacterium]|nr:SemiSWEET transporter [Gammaproteobacteria bacterium]